MGWWSRIRKAFELMAQAMLIMAQLEVVGGEADSPPVFVSLEGRMFELKVHAKRLS